MHPLADLAETDIVLDALPSDVSASIEVRDKYMTGLSMGGGMGLEFLVSDVQRWLPKQVVRVAFLDGDDVLHREIMEATQEISDACSLTLDFGETETGSLRRWSEGDSSYAAEIRVSFDKNGYFSLVGTDSIDGTLGSPNGDVGGRPYQASLNLGGFAVKRPSTWRGTVRHEFLHALGFHHAHQNMRGPCQASFRWDDDEGYQPTKNDRGGFVADTAGRQPGIYTYLAGFPNFWDRMKVDHNLKTEEDPNLIAGPFDPQSVMLYRFPPHFYKSLPSPCAPQGDGQNLSDGDKRGLQLLYPEIATEVAAVVSRQQEIFTAVAGFAASKPAAAGLETATSSMGQIGGTAEVLRRKLAALE